MKDLTIRAKITIGFIAVLIVSLVLNFAVFFVIGEKVAREVAQDDLMEITYENKGEVRYHEGRAADDDPNHSAYHVIELTNGHLEIDDFLDVLNGVGSGLYSGDGELLYGMNLLPAETRDMPFIDDKIRTIQAGEDHFYVLDKLVNKDGDEIWIRGMVDRAQDREKIYRMYRLYMFILPVLVILAAFIAYFMARRSLSPIDRIADDVKVIRQGSDLSHRLDIDTGDNEIRVIVRSLNDMLARLEDSYTKGKQFTSRVSHDLRTPMAVIAAQTELALEQDMPDELREAFELIQKQDARATEILDALLRHNRISYIALGEEKTDVDLSEVVRSTCNGFKSVDEGRVTLEEDVQEGVVVKGNESMLYSLIENLLSNAFKYTEENGYVKVTLKKDKRGTHLSVSDNGIGMSREEQEQAFQWMYQANPSGDEGKGTGLGLFIVKTICDYHDADVTIESEPGRGSTFTVDIPGKEKKDGN